MCRLYLTLAFVRRVTTRKVYLAERLITKVKAIRVVVGCCLSGSIIIVVVVVGGGIVVGRGGRPLDSTHYYQTVYASFFKLAIVLV